jgi:Lar family restriction alleviation protein
MNEKVLPCPFCGNLPYENPMPRVQKDKYEIKYGYAVYCSTCEYYGPWGANRKVAIDAWNTRLVIEDVKE